MAAINSAVLDQYSSAYQSAFTRIQLAMERAVHRAWLGLNTLSDEDEWALLFWTILSGGANAIANLVTGYLGNQLSYLGVTPQLTVPDIAEFMEEQFGHWSTSPIIKARWLVSEGMDPFDAFAETALHAEKLTTAFSRQIEQETKDSLFGVLGQQPVWYYDNQRPDTLISMPRDSRDVDALVGQLDLAGYRMSKKGVGALAWKRGPIAGRTPCGWCQVQSGRLLSVQSRERDRGWHNYCRCVWRMVSQEESITWTDPYADNWREVIDRRYQEAVND